MNLAEAKARLKQQAIHPYAAKFPLFPDDELRNLAVSIQETGLIQALVLDADGQLIDGRNRFVGCALAGVEPRCERLPDGVDPMAYIFAVNVMRRHLPAGARAMAAALSLDFAAKSKVGRGRPSDGQRVIAVDEAGTTQAYISMAKTVHEYAPELVDEILGGGSLNEAYLKYGKPRKEAAEIKHAIIERIRFRHPEIHRRLEAGEITEDLAVLEAEAREQAELTARREEEKREKVRALAREEFPEKPIPATPTLDPIAVREALAEQLGARSANRKSRVAALDEEMAFATRLINLKEQLLAITEGGIPPSAVDWMAPPTQYVTSWYADIVTALNALLEAAQASAKQGTTLRKVQ